MRTDLFTEWLVPFGIVTFAYLSSFAVTFGVLMPIQRLVLPDLLGHASLLFLPHGVRVLTAWLFGWRALLFLTPAALLSHGYLFGVTGLDGPFVFGALFGVACATLSFWVFARLGMECRAGQTDLASWRQIILVGSVASIVNVLGSGYFFGLNLQAASAYFLGDLGGLVAAMLILMGLFRWHRRRG